MREIGRMLTGLEGSFKSGVWPADSPSLLHCTTDRTNKFKTEHALSEEKRMTSLHQ